MATFVFVFLVSKEDRIRHWDGFTCFIWATSFIIAIISRTTVVRLPLYFSKNCTFYELVKNFISTHSYIWCYQKFIARQDFVAVCYRRASNRPLRKYLIRDCRPKKNNSDCLQLLCSKHNGKFSHLFRVLTYAVTYYVL